MRIIALLTLILCCATPVFAENLSVGVGPTGNIFVIDANPQLNPGLGGHIYLDYRWSPQVSTQFSFFTTTQDGSGPNAGDSAILLFGLANVDFKYYPLSSPGKVDPYGLLGIGLYLTSEGSRGDGTMAFGVGASVGIGLDWFLTEKLSLGTSATFRSVGMINAPTGANNGSAIFPLTLDGSIAFHF